MKITIEVPATPEEILAITPPADFQTRFSELLAQSKAGVLSRSGEAELEWYLMLEHLVRLVKAYAFKELSSPLGVEGLSVEISRDEILQFIQEGRRPYTD